MPNNLIKTISDKHNLSVDSVENKWDKAKEIAKKQYNKTEKDEDFYPIVVGILKNMMGIKEETSFSDVQVPERPLVHKEKDDEEEPVLEPEYEKSMDTYIFDADEYPTIFNPSALLNGKNKYDRWKFAVNNKSIVKWANKNYFKKFGFKKDGVIIIAR